MLESGFTIVEIQNHLGHKDIESTMHYIRRHFGDVNIKVRDNFPNPF
jgi:integrase